MICPICQHPMFAVLDLPRFPMTEQFEPWTPAFEPGRGLVDQALLYCETCSYAGLAHHVPAAELYARDYRTRTASSVGASHSVNSFHAFVCKSLRIEDYYGTVIDIGANDSSLLEKFSRARRIAIDPNASGNAELIKDYAERVDFTEFSADRKLILCSHTFEHLEHPAALLNKLREVMTTADVAAFQFPSLDCLVRDARIDQVHHQHLHYFSLRAASLLMAKSGFEITHVAFDEGHYGTLQIVCRRGAEELKGAHIETWRLDDAIADFRAQMKAFGRAIERLREPTCYGASLMFPVLAYWVPQLAPIAEVMDEDKSKWGLRWINCNKRIVPHVGDNYELVSKDRDFIVSAFNTKLAVRKIAAKLGAAGARNVVVPFNAL